MLLAVYYHIYVLPTKFFFSLLCVYNAYQRFSIIFEPVPLFYHDPLATQSEKLRESLLGRDPEQGCQV